MLNTQHDQAELEHKQAVLDMEKEISEARTPELKIQFQKILDNMIERREIMRKWEDELICTPHACVGHPPSLLTPLGHIEVCPIRSNDCTGARRALKQKQNDIDNLMREMGITKDGILFSKNYKELPHIAGIKYNWQRAMTEGKGIVLSGKCETGKTIAACILMRLYLENLYDKLENKTNLRDYHCGYWSLKGLLMHMESKKYEEREGFIQYLSKIRFLILDDIGSIPDPKRYVSMIIDAREGNHLFTCLTTNIDLVDMVGVFGERTASRMTGSRWSIQIETADDHLRQNAGIDEDLF